MLLVHRTSSEDRGTPSTPPALGYTPNTQLYHIFSKITLYSLFMLYVFLLCAFVLFQSFIYSLS